MQSIVKVGNTLFPARVVEGHRPDRQRNGAPDPCYVATTDEHSAIGYGDSPEEAADDLRERLLRA